MARETKLYDILGVCSFSMLLLSLYVAVRG